MTQLALSAGWYIGWGVGIVVVLIAATLLLIVIGLGRRIAGQAEDIKHALDGAEANTRPLWELRTTNHEADRITRGLRAAREMLSR